MKLSLLWIAICLSVVAHTVSTSKGEYTVQFNPPHLRNIIVDTVHDVRFHIQRANKPNFTENATHPMENEYQSNLRFEIKPELDNHVIEIDGNYSIDFIVSEFDDNYTLFLKGLRIGRAHLKWKITRECCNRTECDHEGSCDFKEKVMFGTYDVSVITVQTVIQKTFLTILFLLLTINNINMGCHLCTDVIKDVLKRPAAPIIGLGCQYLFMPLASFGFGKWLLTDHSWRLGLFVLGCSPGGTVSNFWTLIFDGDLELSVTMTFVSTVASIGMMPLWIFTLGSTIFSDGILKVPYLSIVLSLLGLLIPICFGLLIQKYRPKWAEKSRKISRLFTILCLVIAICIGIYSYLHVFYLLNWNVVAAAIAVAWSGYAIGAMFSWFARLNKQQIIAVSIETAVQNVSLAFILLQLSVPQPDADLAAISVAAQLVVTDSPLWVIFTGTFISRYIRRHNSENQINAIRNRKYSIVNANKTNDQLISSV